MVRLPMTPFLRTFGVKAKVTRGEAVGRTFLVIFSPTQEEVSFGKARLLPSRAVVGMAWEDGRNLGVEDLLEVEGESWGVVSLQDDGNGMCVAELDKDMT